MEDGEIFFATRLETFLKLKVRLCKVEDIWPEKLSPLHTRLGFSSFSDLSGGLIGGACIPALKMKVPIGRIFTIPAQSGFSLVLP